MITLKLGALQALVTSFECGHIAIPISSSLSFHCRCTSDYHTYTVIDFSPVSNRLFIKMQPVGMMLVRGLCSLSSTAPVMSACTLQSAETFFAWLTQDADAAPHVGSNLLSLFSYPFPATLSRTPWKILENHTIFLSPTTTQPLPQSETTVCTTKLQLLSTQS